MTFEPWESPYHTSPFWEPEATIVVTTPDFNYEYCETEHEIIEQEKYNESVQAIRTELFVKGWRSAISLPYKSHPDGGLLVTFDLYLDCEILFFCGWDTSNGYQMTPTESGFARPIPVSGGYADSSPSYFFEDDSEFLKSAWLLWAEDFNEHEDYR